MLYVYILRCADNSYYMGRTANIELRLAQHQDGTFGGYTAARRPVKLMWSQQFQIEDEAFKMEHKLKKWSRAKKEALIASDFEKLHTIVEREWKSENAIRQASRAKRSNTSDSE